MTHPVLGKAVAPLLLALVAALVFVAGLAPGVTWLDAGELGAAAWELGIAHPPGFPAAMLVHKAVMLVLPAGDAGFRGNVASALLGAGALGFAAAAAGRWGLGPLATLAALAPVAFAPAFARHAVTIEVYTGVGFLTGVGLFLVARPTGAPPDRRRTLALGLLAGLALGHHAELWLLLGSLTVVHLATDRPEIRTTGRALAAAAVGAAVVAYLPLRAAADPWRDWGHPASPGTLLEHLTGARIRAAYGGEMGLPTVENLFRFAEDVVFPLGPAFAVCLPGLVRLARRPGGAAVAVLLLVDFVYATTLNPMGLRDGQNGLVTPLLFGVGLTATLHWATHEAPSRLLPFARVAAGLTAFVLLWGASPFDRSDDRGAPALTARALEDVPPRGAALVASDTLAAGAAFAQVVEGARPDVAVLVRQHLWDPSSVEPVRRRRPDAFGDWRAGDAPAALPFLADAARRRTLRWEVAGGLDGEWAPGPFTPGFPLFAPVSGSGPGDGAQAALAASSRFVRDLADRAGLVEPQARRTLSLWYEDVSQSAASGPVESAEAYARALALRPEAAAAIHGRRAAFFAARGEPATALGLAHRALAADPEDPARSRDVARYALNAGDPAMALGFADAAVELGPGDAEALGLRGMARARLGRFDEAEADFRAALVLDPAQPEAVVGMKRLGEMR